MDLRTGETYVVDNLPMGLVIDPYDQDSINRCLFVAQPLPMTLRALERVLLYTMEEVEIPGGYVGDVALRSTFARMGLLIPTTYADPGFKGTLTMEVFNGNRNPILIHPGMHMWELILKPAPFEPLYEGRYQNQPAQVVLPKALKEGT